MTCGFWVCDDCVRLALDERVNNLTNLRRCPSVDDRGSPSDLVQNASDSVDVGAELAPDHHLIVRELFESFNERVNL
tara:strand:- start:58 stop:288 length:231 start_codon:yes stop_codon:yes gene_type:complete